MGQYEPGNENRGTCPYCERRVAVCKPGSAGGTARSCRKHKPPNRTMVFTDQKVCPGSGLICLEDGKVGQ